jgi:hypothetical protein
VNPRGTPQRIGRDHSLDQAPKMCRGDGATSMMTKRLRQPRPEPTKPFALPSHNRIRLDVVQGTAPFGPQAAKTYPKHSIQCRQNRTLALSPEGGELHSQGYVLDGDGLMTAQQEPKEPKDR